MRALCRCPWKTWSTDHIPLPTKNVHIPVIAFAFFSYTAYISHSLSYIFPEHGADWVGQADGTTDHTCFHIFIHAPFSKDHLRLATAVSSLLLSLIFLFV